VQTFSRSDFRFDLTETEQDRQAAVAAALELKTITDKLEEANRAIRAKAGVDAPAGACSSTGAAAEGRPKIRARGCAGVEAERGPYHARRIEHAHHRGPQRGARRLS
jgi:hypothetical protein